MADGVANGINNGQASENEAPAVVRSSGDAVNPVTQAEINRIAKEVLDTTIGPATAYSFGDSTVWNQQVVERITAQLVATGRPFKYIVTSSLLQTSTGSGLNVSCVSYWNKTTDSSFSYRWEGRFIMAIINVFVISF